MNPKKRRFTPCTQNLKHAEKTSPCFHWFLPIDTALLSDKIIVLMYLYAKAFTKGCQFFNTAGGTYQ